MRGAKPAIWIVALALALVGAGAVFAQDATVKKPRRPQPPAATAPQSPAPGAASVDASGVISPLPLRGPDTLAPIPPPVTPPLQAMPGAAPPALRSAVGSRWSAPATIASRGGGACRAQCATSRIACLAPQVQDDAPRCNAQWTSCLSTCDGLTYGRAGAP